MCMCVNECVCVLTHVCVDVCMHGCACEVQKSVSYLLELELQAVTSHHMVTSN